MKSLVFAAILLPLLATPSFGDDAVKPAPAATPKNPEATDISGLEKDYWRPNKDELEVVQNRKYDKAGRLELAAQYGIFQGQDFVDSKSYGGSLTYNISNMWFVEGSYMHITNSPNDLLTSVQKQYGFTPGFSEESQQEVLSVGFVPIYAKFALFGQEISHFEMYIAPGIGMTDTEAEHLSGHLTIGQKFYITEHILFRIEWRITKFTDQITTPTGATSVANGGPGYIKQSETTNNIIFGLGVMY